METNFDFVVIGGGSAGYAAARTAAAQGLRTAVVEGGSEIGGLCILRGCMPSKTLIESANRFLTLRRAEEFGLSAGSIGFDATRILERKQRLVGEFADYRREQLEDGEFVLLRGRASFVDPNTVRLEDHGDTMTLQSQSFLIATGSVINTPGIPGLEHPDILNSDKLLATAEVPESVAVLGGGPVALEAAHYFEGLGAKVSIVQRSPHVLRGVDFDVAETLAEAFEKRGMQIFTKTSLQEIRRGEDGFEVVFEHNGGVERLRVAAVFNGLGRRPAIDSLALDVAGVEVSHGAVETGVDQQTSVPHIFAAGDVCGPYEIVHIAIEQGEVAARNAARLVRGSSEPFETLDYRLKLFAVFTQPQVAVAGLSEHEVRETGAAWFSAKHPFADHGKSMVHGDTEGFVKLVAEAKTGEILGASVIGPEASELIHEVVVAMRYHATVQDFAAIPHYHPTLSEIWTYPAEELASLCGKASIPSAQ